MKKLTGILIAFLSAFSFASGGDTLVYNAEFDSLADGDTLRSGIHMHAPAESVKSIINGRLGNVNLAANADIDQRKIDSTATYSTDWIYNYTRKITEWSAGAPVLKSPRGMSFRVNDSTANTGTFAVYDDSTKRLFKLTPDSALIYKTLSCSSTMKADSGFFAKGVKGTIGNFTTSLISAKLNLGQVTAKTLSGDSLYQAGLSFVSVTGQGAAADSLKYISTASASSGDLIIIICGAYDVSIFNTGNILGAANLSVGDTAILILNQGTWYMLVAFDN